MAFVAPLFQPSRNHGLRPAQSRRSRRAPRPAARASAPPPDPRPSVSLVSLGCPKNVTDAEVMLGDLASKGIRVETGDPDTPCDVTLINTCAFVEHAARESLDAILDAARRQADDPRTKGIIVTGCLAQRYAADLARELPEVDAVVGFAHYGSLAARVAQLAARDARTVSAARARRRRESEVAVGATDAPFRPEHARVRLGPRHSAYVRVAEGCPHACAFCVIPGQLRGGVRSKPWVAVTDEIDRLVAGGARELVFIAEDTNRYGVDLAPGETRRLCDLLRHVAETQPRARWLRLLYCYPSHFTDELIQAIATLPAVCKYVDLPLQHICDTVLRRMNRPPRGETERLLGRLRDCIPGLALRTTFISGFPGETEEEHRELVAFIKRERFRHASFFAYSEEEGTPAAGFEDQVPMEVRENRRDELAAIQQGIQEEIAEGEVGKVLEVMVDRIEDGHSIGRTQYDAPEIDANVHILQEIEPGTLLNVRILGTSSFDLYGEPAQ